jgi:serine/threonine-protein kinase RsbW
MVKDRADLQRTVEAVMTALAGAGYSRAAAFGVRLAMEEAVVNAMTHGHRGLPAGTPVRLEFQVSPSRIELSVEDRGPGFSPCAVPDPTLDENLETPTGRGIMLMRAYMTRVSFNERGNRVTMVYEAGHSPRRA